jgi:hypothetical protein
MNWKIILCILIFIELVTIFGRFGLKIRSKDIFIKIMKRFKLKGMVHIHHGYFGALLMIISIYYPIIYNWPIFSIGLAVFLSDVIHHLVVLNFIVGNPEFYIFYKNNNFYKIEKKFEKGMNKFFSKLVDYN